MAASVTQIFEIPFHIGDFLSGTIHMDAEQTGAYMMLLVAHYNAGAEGLPNDDKQLARIAKVSPRVWKRIKPILEQKFIVNENFWAHEKCRKVLRKIQERSNAARGNALKKHASGDADAQPQHSQGDAIHLTTYPLNLKERTPLPPQGSGSLKPSVSEGSGEGGDDPPEEPFDIREYLTDECVSACREAAPGWDIYSYLAEIYNDGIASGERERPKIPEKAFPAWCGRYTKGKPP